MPEGVLGVLPERLAKAVKRRSGAFALLRLATGDTVFTVAQSDALASKINEAEMAATEERSALVAYWVKRTKADFGGEG